MSFLVDVQPTLIYKASSLSFKTNLYYKRKKIKIKRKRENFEEKERKISSSYILDALESITDIPTNINLFLIIYYIYISFIHKRLKCKIENNFKHLKV